MNSKTLKSLVSVSLLVTSSLALVNCGDDSASATEPAVNEPALSSVAEIPASSAEVPIPEISSSSVDALPLSSVAELPAVSSAVEDLLSSSSVVPETGAMESSSSIAEESSSSIVEESSSSEEAVVSSSSEAAKVKIFLAQADDERDGGEVVYIENTGYNGQGILAYPKNLSTDPNVKHGVVVWGPGGDTAPGMYGGMIRRLASHGFVVIALSISPGTGENAKAAIDWLEEKNKDVNGPLYQKMDLEHVGCAGHSMGGLESEQAAIKDARVVTACLNNSGDKQHVAMGQIPAEKSAINIYGEAGIERDNARADYNNANVKARACLIQMTGGPQGGEGGWGHGSASWSGIAATIAWMRWQIGGEDRKADFVGTSGKYINGPIIGEQGSWDGQCKNF